MRTPVVLITGAGGEILMRETFRILREGGRCLFVVELASKKDELPSDQLRAEPGVQHALSALTSHGFRGARVLAARENRAYVEAAKPRSAGASA